MKEVKLYNRYINASINWYYGRTPYYYERGRYNKAYKVTGRIKGFKLKANLSPHKNKRLIEG